MTLALILPDGTLAGVIERVEVAVTTDSGTHDVPLEDVVTLTKTV